MSDSGRTPPPIGRGLAWLGLAGLGALWAYGSARSVPAVAAGRARAGDVEGGGHAAQDSSANYRDRGPGDEHPDDAEGTSGVLGYTLGLGLAAALTAASFGLPATGLVWGPALPAALIVFAIAQMGVHLVFFLHLTTGPDNLNNAMALAFGCLIVLLVIGGSLWIMWHLNQNMMPMGSMTDMRR